MNTGLQPNRSAHPLAIDLETTLLVIERCLNDQTLNEFERCALDAVLRICDAITLVADHKLGLKLKLIETINADELANAQSVWRTFATAVDLWCKKSGEELSTVIYWTIKTKVRPSIRAILDNSYDFRAYYWIKDDETKNFLKHLVAYFNSTGV